MGGHASTRIWDYAAEYMGSPAKGGVTTALSPSEAGYKKKVEQKTPPPQQQATTAPVRTFGG